MDLEPEELEELVKLALPHDFGATLLFLDRTCASIGTDFQVLRQYLDKVRLFLRLKRIRHYIEVISERFDQFWLSLIHI